MSKQKTNVDVRAQAKNAGVFLWQVADVLNISEPTLLRHLRYELSEDDKGRIYDAINAVCAQEGTV